MEINNEESTICRKWKFIIFFNVLVNKVFVVDVMANLLCLSFVLWFVHKTFQSNTFIEFFLEIH